jgi:HNH endonuclease
MITVMIHTFQITRRNGDTHTVYIDTQDRALIEQYTWYISSNGYACTKVHTATGPYTLLLHRLLMNPGELHVDHVNRNKLDNRRCNLRVCSDAQNKRNRDKQINNTSGYRGVCLDGRTYRVQISLNGTRSRHGHYTTKHAAAIMANIKRRELHGDYSVGDCTSNLHSLYYPELVH